MDLGSNEGVCFKLWIGVDVFVIKYLISSIILVSRFGALIKVYVACGDWKSLGKVIDNREVNNRCWNIAALKVFVKRFKRKFWFAKEVWNIPFMYVLNDFKNLIYVSL